MSLNEVTSRKGPTNLGPSDVIYIDDAEEPVVFSAVEINVN
jgi:hypothetical protein